MLYRVRTKKITCLLIVLLALLLIGTTHAEETTKEESPTTTKGEEGDKNNKKKKTAEEKYLEDLKKQRDYLANQTSGIVMDLRKNTKFESALPWIFYLPLSAIYLGLMFVTLLYQSYQGLRLLCKSADPSEKEIDKVDASSIEQITLAKLTELNKERGDDRVKFGDLMLLYTFMNLRTEFEADDVFSQKTAIMAYQHGLRTKPESYADSQLLADEHPNDGYGRMTEESQIEVNKTVVFRRFLQIMCILSLGASLLALGQIFQSILDSSRIIVLTPFENAFLRICFGIIILFIVYRDLQQIQINLACRLTGAVMPPIQSRFIYAEAFIRTFVTILAFLAIIFTIFSTPEDDVEGIIDQTMNFTALVVILEVDNILAGLFQKQVDKLEVDFGYDPETIQVEFNRAADFVQNRRKLFWCQYWIEQLFIVICLTMLFLVFTFLPIFILLFYVVIPLTGPTG